MNFELRDRINKFSEREELFSITVIEHLMVLDTIFCFWLDNVS